MHTPSRPSALAALISTSLALAACGSDPVPTAPTDGGMDARVTDAPAADAPRVDRTAVDTAPMTTMCGAATCSPADLLVVTTPACCAAANACGLEVTEAVGFAHNFGIDLPFTGCIALNQPGTDDARCPDLTRSLGEVQVRWAGCCRPSGVCGLHANLRIPGLTDDAPDFGCIDASGTDGGVPRPCGPATDGGTDGATHD